MQHDDDPPVIRKASTKSTNDDVFALAAQGYPHFTTVTADFQTEGRGRQGKKWLAPRNASLLFSTLLRIEADPAVWLRIPQIAGTLIVQSVEKLYGEPSEPLQLKWPNDLYHRGKKWGGILVESKLGPPPCAVLGAGINCTGRAADYGDSINRQITTLEEIYLPRPIERLEVLGHFLDLIKSQLDDLLDDFSPVVAFANERDYTAGKRLTVQSDNETIQGTSLGVAPGGELILASDNGRKIKVASGGILQIE